MNKDNDNNFTIIRNIKLKKDIVTALADEISRAILDSTIDKSKTVEDIITEKNISHTSAYRKVNWLLSKQLLFIEQGEKNSINKSRFLRSRFRIILICYRQGIIEIEVKSNKKIYEI